MYRSTRTSGSLLSPASPAPRRVHPCYVRCSSPALSRKSLSHYAMRGHRGQHENAIEEFVPRRGTNTGAAGASAPANLKRTRSSPSTPLLEGQSVETGSLGGAAVPPSPVLPASAGTSGGSGRPTSRLRELHVFCRAVRVSVVDGDAGEIVLGSLEGMSLSLAATATEVDVKFELDSLQIDSHMPG